MIENQSEFDRTVSKLNEAHVRLKEQEIALRERGLSEDHIRRALDPMRSFYLQLEQEVANYQKLHGS